MRFAVKRSIFCLSIGLAILAIPAVAGNESNYRYLALGDSVAFGYNPTVTNLVPESFVGYPELVADALHMATSKKEVNASCPGQSSSSFLYGGPDIGCEPFRAAVGLHTAYSGTQMNFAISQLQSNKHINLVTLSIGGNDLSLLQAQCATAPSFLVCVQQGLTGVLTTYSQNLAVILGGIRSEYSGTIVLLKYNFINTDPLFQHAIQLLNQAMMDVGSQFPNVKFADGYAAFEFASATSGGDPCEAGLLVRLSDGTCDIHPSLAGQKVLASAVLVALSH